jgi:hypothetical protein
LSAACGLQNVIERAIALSKDPARSTFRTCVRSQIRSSKTLLRYAAEKLSMSFVERSEVALQQSVGYSKQSNLIMK